MTLDTCCSPNANSVNGKAFMSAPTTATCPHAARSRGSGSRLIASTTTTNRAPSAIRASATCSGDQTSSSTLMHRKLEPQIAARARNWKRHDCMTKERAPDADREVITATSGCRGGIDEQVGEHVAATPLRMPLQAQREAPA